MPTAGDDYIANDFRDPNYMADISTGAGEDFIWTHLFAPVMHIDGGSGFDIFKIPDGWLGNFKIQRSGDDYIINHNNSAHIIYVTNVELVILDTFDSYVELFQDPFFDEGNNYVNYNSLNGEQTGLFRSVNLYLSSNIRGGDLYPDLYNSGDGDDEVYLPNAANYVIWDDSYDPVDRIWDFGRYFNAGRGDDKVHGGDYHDKINGDEGFDRLWGGAGNDMIYDNAFGGSSSSVGGWIDGGAGKDTVQLTFTPSRIVDASGTVVWSRGGPTTYNNNGQQLFAEYLDAAGKVVGRVEMNNIETIIQLTSTPAPSEQLFSGYADDVNFTQLTSGQRAAIDAMQTAGSLTGMYSALDGDDTVVLPTNGTLVGKTAKWDSSITFKAGYGRDHVIGSSGPDSIDGGGGDDRIEGAGGNDVLIDDGGNDVLDGGAGADDMSGGYGDDSYYVDHASDVATELSFHGDDTVFSTISYALNPYFERLTLIGNAAINGSGNGEQNTITGNGAANQLYGFGGNDTLNGAAGDDRLDGGTGNDMLYGGTGADTYFVDSAGDVTSDEGIDVDLVRSTATHTLGASIENLTLEGGAAINGTGNELDNVIIGNSAANILDGAEGNDVLEGRGGNDHYVVRETADEVLEVAGGGTDIVESHVSYTLGANLENLTLGGTNSINATGNAVANVIVGNAGSNLIDGGAGADTMAGGFGNDTYFVDVSGDLVSELADQGTDQVFSLVAFTLGTGLENLTLVGTRAISGFGNDLGNLLEGNSAANVLTGLAGDDRLKGNEGNDTLDGGAGLDRLYGGLGNDTYYVNDATDYAYENASEGLDQVYSSISHVLRANLETLWLTGTAALNGHGNDIGNSIYGNAANNKLFGLVGDDRLFGGDGNDVLDGGAGLDRLYGGLGDDTYYVRDTTDYSYENVGEGTDRVYASVTHTLRANIEYLYLTGTAAIGGTGNDLGNLLSGNSAGNSLKGLAGDDRLFGEAGNDVLEGGSGRDQLTGGSGADRFIFRDGDSGGSASTADIILDFSQADGDRIRLDAIDANTVVAGDQAFAFIGTAAFSGTAGELRYAQVSGNTYLSGDTNGDGLADWMLRLDGLHAISTSNLVL